MNLSNQNQRMVDAAREILEGKNEESINEVTRAYANAKITKADIKMVLAAAKKAGAKIKGNIAEFPNGTKIQIEIWHDVRIGFQSLNDPYARGGFEVFFGAKEAIKDFKKKKYTKVYESREEYSLEDAARAILEEFKGENLQEVNSDAYRWEDINKALMATGFGPKVIIKVLQNLKGKKIKEDADINEDYIEVMDPSLLHKAKQNILTAWEQWRRGPETERQDIKPAAAELKKDLTDWMKKNIK